MKLAIFLSARCVQDAGSSESSPSERIMTEKSLFFSNLPVQHSSPFSFPVHDAALLEHVARDASVWLVGNSCRVRAGLDGLLRFLKPVARSIRDSGLSLDEDPGKLRAVLDEISSAPSAILLLAAEAYGPAYARLCAVAPPLTPVLLPNGFLTPTLPSAGLVPTHPEAASTKDVGRALAALAGKRLVFWATPDQYRYRLKPLITAYCPGATVVGLTGAAWETWSATTPDGLPVVAPGALPGLACDVVVASLEGADRTHAALHAVAPRLTPVIFVQQKGLLSHAAFACEAARAIPGFAARLYYNPYLTREKYAALYKDCPEYSPAHYDSVRTTRLPLTLRGNTYGHADVSRDRLHIRDGLRLTTDTHPRADNHVHLFGPSYVLGTLSDDANTIASHLQRLGNAASRAGDGRLFNVHNHGVAGNSLENIVRQVENTPLSADDIVLVMPPYQQYDDCVATLRHIHAHCRERGAQCAIFFQPSLFGVARPSAYESRLLEEYRRLHGLLFAVPESTRKAFDVSRICLELTACGVPAFDLQARVQRPHGWGEIFVDFIHTAAKGNACIARAMSDMFLENILAVPRDDVPARAAREFLEHVKNRFLTHAEFIDWLEAVPRFPAADGQTVGAIVMNCNPFTIGHQHIIGRALESADRLYVFVVEEDASAFSFRDRITMIRQGVEMFGNRLLVVPSGRFILSSFTFPEYFCKDTVRYLPDASVESALFGTLIAPALGIRVRFFGEEPLCPVTRAYHAQLQRLLPLCGIACREIPRLALGNAPVSASRVRRLLRERRLDDLPSLVPLTTLRHVGKMLRNGTITRFHSDSAASRKISGSPPAN